MNTINNSGRGGVKFTFRQVKNSNTNTNILNITSPVNGNIKVLPSLHESSIQTTAGCVEQPLPNLSEVSPSEIGSILHNKQSGRLTVEQRITTNNSFNKPNDNSIGRGRGRGRGKFIYSRGYHHNYNGPPKIKPISIAIPSEIGRNIEVIQNPPVSAINVQQTGSILHQINPQSNQDNGVKQMKKAPSVSSYSRKYLRDNETTLISKLYFPTGGYNDPDTRKHISAFKCYISENLLLFNLSIIRKTFWFPLYLKKLLADSKFTTQWPDFLDNLTNKPEYTIKTLNYVMHETLLDHCNKNHDDNKNITNSRFDKGLQDINVRILEHTPIISNLRTIKANLYGRLLTVRGIIISSSTPQIICTWMAFTCSNCHTEQTIKQIDNVATFPKSCPGNGCKMKKNFLKQLDSVYTRVETEQTIRIQESLHGYDISSMPKNIEIELTEDLVNCYYPGDEVIVTGYLKAENDNQNGKRKTNSSLHTMFIKAISITSEKNSNKTKFTELSEKDYQLFDMIKSEPCPFRLLVHSLCPKIFGNEMVKAGLILAIFSGGNSGEFDRRTESHILIVGDPGVGKSVMLQACANVSPKGIFVGGNNSSGAGLTATVRHEKGIGGTLEAGALVLADGGICCVDEFDKMANHKVLLEAMEQQIVSVAKAGVLCSLPARTCVFAAANPSEGHYNKGKTVAENIKMCPALLSRFDLVFILLDRPDIHLDKLFTEHIQALHCRMFNENNRHGATTNILSGTSCVNTYLQNHQNIAMSSSSSSSQTMNIGDSFQQRKPISEHLKLRQNENIERLPHVLMQKYIGYAKDTIQPNLSDDAKDLLKKYYLELRVKRNGIDCIPVTTRQLEGLIRLTLARARIDLQSIATIQHALDVIEISRFCLIDVLSTDAGTLQLDRSINGCGMSVTKQARKLYQILAMKSNTLNKTVFTLNELKEMTKSVAGDVNITRLIDSMNLQGFLLMKGNNLYEFLKD